MRKKRAKHAFRKMLDYRDRKRERDLRKDFFSFVCVCEEMIPTMREESDCTIYIYINISHEFKPVSTQQINFYLFYEFFLLLERNYLFHVFQHFK